MSEQSFTGNEVAIIGMSGRFPRSSNLDEYWKNIIEGNECITFFEDEELLDAGVDESMLKQPNYVKAFGMVDGIAKFEPEFFQYTDRDALLMDPQMRLLHEVVWQTLEDAGYNHEEYKKKIGLYLGAADNLFWQVLSTMEDMSSMAGCFATSQINNKDFVATQIAYKLNLRGPGVTLVSACSTSLLSIHTACESLLAGDCDMALAGGVTVLIPDKRGYLYEEGMILSKDGHCRTFDADSSGTVEANGVGVVALKLYEDAVRDHDQILAVIRGSAVNNDGARKVGYSAPSIDGQAEVIRLAQKIANVKPDSIGYIEAHGTATKMGDPIEVEALKQAFRTDKKNYCAIGSVKSNIGHTDIASGIAGFMKAVLMLQNKMIPPTVNLNKLNPFIKLEDSPFYINKEAKKWEQQEAFRIGVSGFGIGGTNVHVILEETPEEAKKQKSKEKEEYRIFPFSARDAKHLKATLKNYLEYLDNGKGIRQESNLADIAFTLQSGRKVFSCTETFVAKGKEELSSLIAKKLEKGIKEGKNNTDANIVFLFPGQGAQYPNMGKELIERFPVFRENLFLCLDLASKISGKPYNRILFDEENQKEIYQTDCAQIYIFAFEYALAKLLNHFGIQPDNMIGHSLGEYAAACLAGVFTVEEAMYIIVERGRLMKQVPEGAMLSVQADAESLKKLLGNSISIASANSAKSTVLSGTVEAIESVKPLLEENELQYVKLHTLRAFHSEMMEEILGEFKKVLSNINFCQPKQAYMSCYTGDYVTDEVMTPEYWCKQLRNAVLFEKGIERIAETKNSVFVEVGPGTTLSSFVHDILSEREEVNAYNLIRHVKQVVPADKYFLERLGKLWELGIQIRWEAFWTGEEYRVSLPVYPFDGKEFMLDGDPFEILSNAHEKDENKGYKRHSSKGDTKQDVSDWMYVPSYYSENILTQEKLAPAGTCLVFVNEDSYSEKLIACMKSQAIPYILVKRGENYSKQSEEAYVINPDVEEDYQKLWKELGQADIGTLIHMWNVMEEELDFAQMKTLGVYSLMYLSRNFVTEKSLSCVVVTNGLLDIFGSEKLSPSKSMIMGVMKVIPQEQSNLRTKLIDIDLSEADEEDVYQNILAECNFTISGKVIGYRGKRWVQSYESVKLSSNDVEAVTKDDVIAVTGALGYLGRKLCTHLYEQYHCKIAMLVHHKLPARGEWEILLNELDKSNPLYQSIHTVMSLEEKGAEILILDLDITDKKELEQAIEDTESKLGKITGFIHLAGRTDFNMENSMLDKISVSECERQFNAKVLGAKALAECTEGRQLKFCMLFSSLASVLGGYGFLAYSAGNSYLDILASKMNKKSKTRWISINWDNWYEESQEINPLCIMPEEGFSLLNTLFVSKENQVLVSTYDLMGRLEKWVWMQKDEMNQDMIAAEENEEEISEDNIQAVLLEIMSRQLGKDDLDEDDNFFEMGGDSLKALSIIAAIRKKLNRTISLAEFTQNPTIHEMVQFFEVSAVEAEIPRAEEKEYYRLCKAQERLLLLNQMHKERLSYNLPQYLTFEGKMDGKKFVDCIYKLAERHEAMRSSFHYVNNQALQKIHETNDFDIAYMELSEEDANKEIEEFIKPFDLDRPGAFRSRLIRVGEETYWFLFDVHHIISDAGAFKVFFEELAQLYEGKELSEIKVRYRDVCEYENSDAYREKIQKQEEFWLEQMQAPIPELNVTTDYLRNEVLNFDGATMEFSLDTETSKKINELVIKHNTTKFIFFLTVYNILLSKLSEQQDIIIGTPVARRSNASIQNIFGHFVNVLPLRNYPKGEKTFEQFLHEVSKRTLESFENEDFSFKSLIERLHLTWKRNRNPLFDTMLIMQNMNSNTCNLPGVKVIPNSLEGKSSKFDLTFEIFESDAGYEITVEYCTELFERGSIERYTDYMKKIIQQVLGNDNMKLEEIKFANENEAVMELSDTFDF